MTLPIVYSVERTARQPRHPHINTSDTTPNDPPCFSVRDAHIHASYIPYVSQSVHRPKSQQKIGHTLTFGAFTMSRELGSPILERSPRQIKARDQFRIYSHACNLYVSVGFSMPGACCTLQKEEYTNTKTYPTAISMRRTEKRKRQTTSKTEKIA